MRKDYVFALAIRETQNEPRNSFVTTMRKITNLPLFIIAFEGEINSLGFSYNTIRCWF